jgi:type IV pilus assembly protein PilX
MMYQAPFIRGRATQSGAVLVTGLVFLVVLTMFVLALVRSGTLEERMARNSRDQLVAREAAEAVLRDAEATLFTAPPFDRYEHTRFTKTCTDGYCFKPAPTHTWDKIDWKSEQLTRTFSGTRTISDLTTQPRYIVEIITQPVKPNSSTPCTPGVARITARAQGNTGAIAIVQTTVRFAVFSNSCD